MSLLPFLCLNDENNFFNKNLKNKLAYRPSGYFSACLHLGQCQASVGTVNRPLLNLQPLTTSYSILLKQPPRGPAALLSHRHVETPPFPLLPPSTPVETLRITWYGVYPWKLDWIAQTLPAGQELTCLSSLQLLLLNWSLHKTLSHSGEASEGETLRHFLCTIFSEDMLRTVTRQAARPLLHTRHPLKVFSFRTQGSHLLWNLIEGLFINFLRSKFLLQRKRWHTKKCGTAGCSVLRFFPADASGRRKVYMGDMRGN